MKGFCASGIRASITDDGFFRKALRCLDSFLPVDKGGIGFRKIPGAGSVIFWLEILHIIPLYYKGFFGKRYINTCFRYIIWYISEVVKLFAKDFPENEAA